MGLVSAQRSAPPQERWLDRPAAGRRVVLDSTAGPVLAASAVLAALATRRPDSAARRHQPHQLLQPTAPAAASRQTSSTTGCPAIYSFQVSRRPGRLDAPPDVLTRMERVETELRTLPSCGRSPVSPTTQARDPEMDGDRPEAAPIPAAAEAIAQELFVFWLSDEGRAELERVVSSDFSHAQITVKLASHELGPPV